MQDIGFELEGEYVELNQLLKLCGVVDSGGAGKALVASGAVRVDGAVELRKTCKIRAGQVVEAEGVRILKDAQTEADAATAIQPQSATSKT